MHPANTASRSDKAEAGAMQGSDINLYHREIDGMAQATDHYSEQRLEPGMPVRIKGTKVPVRQILGRNPGPMTGPGTNSYLVGANELALIDPGPADQAQLDSFLAALGEVPLRYILVTHTHRDHSPGAMALAEATGAELVGQKAPDAMGQDHSFVPAGRWQGGEVIALDGFSIELIATPGHVSNHICYLLREEKLLFTGDHILQGTTPVILPPDGDMADYLNSLEILLNLDLRFLAPGHGVLMDEPKQEIERLIAHRLKREGKIVDCVKKLGPATIDDIVRPVYDDIPEHLIPWAKKTLLAHLYKLAKENRAQESGENWSMLS